MDQQWRRAALQLAACAALVAVLQAPVHSASSSVDAITVDLAPLIDAAARYPTRFAVDVAHSVSLSSQGQWSDNGVSSTWNYTARIATAVSMSFYASRIS